jgi:enamine deaminase RidA (YjgF/YER057c/UK114 family)
MMDKKSIVPQALQSSYTDWHYSPAIQSENFLFVSGCTGSMPDGTISYDIANQVRQAFKNIELSLTEAGLTFSDVIEMTTFHVGLKEQLDIFKQIKDEFIDEPYPAWTAIGVSELAIHGTRIEIRVIAKGKKTV